MRHSDQCVFCDIIAGKGPATVVYEWDDAIAITPKDPVTPGHTLVIPFAHLMDAGVAPSVTGAMAAHAAELAGQWPTSFNLIVNAGEAASMTIPHLHWHIVPRREATGCSSHGPGRR